MDALLQPLDRIRLRVLHAMGPVASMLAADREMRVALVGSIAVLTTLALALSAPLWVLALGPVVWGVPHVVADVRYLVVRPGLHRMKPLALGTGAWLVVAAFGGGLTAALLAAATAAILVPNAHLAKRSVVASTALTLAYVAWSWHLVVDAAFVQVHNAVALFLWWQWRQRDEKTRGNRGSRAVVLVLAAIATALILTGTVGTHLPPLAGWTSPFRAFRLGGLADSLAPGAAGTWGLRLVYLYAFGQSLHYVVWLRLIPEDDRPSETPRTFRASWSALRNDLGIWILGAAALGAGLYIVATLFDGLAARNAYLRFSSVHGYLEIAALGAFLTMRASKTARMAPSFAPE